MVAVSFTMTRLLLLLLLVSFTFQPISSVTHPEDVTALQSLMSEWGNTPPSWRKSADPCGFPWEGVECNNDNRVITLKLSSMGLKGNLEGGDISNLKELTTLDLSFNKDLTGSISPQLGHLRKLNTLMLAGCGFSGSIPQELGNLSELYFLALNSNKLTGGIPASLGNLSKLYWLDLSDNQLTGSLPVSDTSSPGLDMLQIGHFHLSKNQLSGAIPPQMFSSKMTKLIHVLLNGNQLSGSIPSTIGLVQSLNVLRLDLNNLSGEVPFNLNNLTSLNDLNLANNQLTGPLPNLTGMTHLQSLDLSNNTFDESEIPDWLSKLNALMTLVIENGPFNGVLPETLFSLPGLQQVRLKYNKINGELDMGNSTRQQLKLVDLQLNEITSVTSNVSYNSTLILAGNPVCSISNPLAKTKNCQLQPQAKSYSTNLGKCVSTKCSEKDQKPSPHNCKCVYPYQGTFYFNPYFGDLTNYTRFQMLEKDMSMKLQLAPESVFLENIHFNRYDELQIDLSLFPTNEEYFNRTQVQMIGFELTNHTYSAPFNLSFGPFIFLADPYNFQVMEENHGKSSLRRILILVVVIPVLTLIVIGMYFMWKRRRSGHRREFVSSGTSTLDLKGARWLSYDELKKCTNNFSPSNEIGSGGYGKVYRGMLSNGQLVAIKRGFKQGSMQGMTEFKTEIELLSRVHHKNLVSLIGFCFEQAEKILVYEFLPNGSLKDNLLGKSGIHLDWRKRLQIALGSARGLAYLHELANPPIIHRDVKSANILLDDNLNAKVADFGLSKLLSNESMDHLSTQVKGTMGYVDPEYYLLLQLTEKSDVYSFGVVMLELLTAKHPIEKGKYVVREVRTILDKANHDSYGLSELLDPALGSFTASLQGLAMYVELALRCTEESASDRPNMGEVVKVSGNILGAPSMAAVSFTMTRLLLLLFLVSVKFHPISSVTDPGDLAALQSLMTVWENTPPSWKKSDDPCGFLPWEGITCNNYTRIIAINLSTMGLKGSLGGGDIGNLGELTSLDLSFNIDLTGSLSSKLGQLNKLNTLMLAGCGFSGSIPQELGDLSELHFLALNSNKFTGGIPASLGNLSKLYWLDLSDNQLTGSLPVSPGLDKLLQIGHFHLNKNQLSGAIPPQMFSSEMTKLIHVLLNGNQLTGSIPSTIGLVQQLEVLRLDINHLTGEIPVNLNNLTKITDINLANNKLTGLLPKLTRMNYLQSLDLSNNTFTESEFPDSFLTLNSLMTLVIENGPLNGALPDTLFRLPGLEQVKLKKNKLSGKIDMSNGDNQQLQLIDLQENEITSVTINSSSNTTLILVGNPVCSISNPLAKTKKCQLQPQAKPYSTKLGKCVSTKCSEKDQKPSPQSCECVYPYQGTLYFNPLFGDLTNYTRFQMLENDMSMKLQLAQKSVFLENIHFNCYDELQIDLSLFPTDELYFNRTQVQMIGFELTNHIYLPPSNLSFGPYIFIADPYNFEVLEDNNGKSALSLTMILVISIGCSLLVLMLLGMFLIRYKKRNGRSTGFASTGSEGSVALHLKGTRWFAYEELKKCTNNFSSRNEIGSGGYGKVYRGMLPDGQLVAIKRGFKQGSMQGMTEFKTEIELLSRVHHKNLVSLIGFCFEKAEKILVYEFLPNGSLKDSLLGKSGIHLDWRKRLQIALGSARGLAYLHELANPPIIHRDVKSTNILLDDNLNAKVADFGLSKLLSDGSMDHVSTQIKGTMGYVDPEYYLLQQLTEKSDVYSFGVVLLELLTAKQPIEKGKYVVREVRTILDKGNNDSCGLRDIVDPAIGSVTASLPEFAMYVELALRCTEESASDRPTMGEVVKAIETILHVKAGQP